MPFGVEQIGSFGRRNTDMEFLGITTAASSSKNVRNGSLHRSAFNTDHAEVGASQGTANHHRPRETQGITSSLHTQEKPFHWGEGTHRNVMEKS